MARECPGFTRCCRWSGRAAAGNALRKAACSDALRQRRCTRPCQQAKTLPAQFCGAQQPSRPEPHRAPLHRPVPCSRQRGRAWYDVQRSRRRSRMPAACIRAAVKIMQRSGRDCKRQHACHGPAREGRGGQLPCRHKRTGAYRRWSAQKPDAAALGQQTTGACHSSRQRAGQSSTCTDRARAACAGRAAAGWRLGWP